MKQPVYPWSKDDVQIIKAAAASDAGRLALNLIVDRLAGIQAGSFSSDALQMAFNEGRRFVGIELSRVINNPMDKIVREPDEPRSSRLLTATERADQRARESNAG